MTGKPQRDTPKENIRVLIDEDVYEGILPLLNNDRMVFASMSQLVETILFLSEHIYAEEPDDGFAVELAKIKARRAIAQIEAFGEAGTRHLHLTLDARAVSFLNMLARTYRMLFRNRRDALEVLLLNIGMLCKTPQGIRYCANRLYDVLDLHPTQTKHQICPDA